MQIIFLILLLQDSIPSISTGTSIPYPPPPASGSIKDYLVYLALVGTITVVGSIWRMIEIKLLKKRWTKEQENTKTKID